MEEKNDQPQISAKAKVSAFIDCVTAAVNEVNDGLVLGTNTEIQNMLLAHGINSGFNLTSTNAAAIHTDSQLRATAIIRYKLQHILTRLTDKYNDPYVHPDIRTYISGATEEFFDKKIECYAAVWKSIKNAVTNALYTYPDNLITTTQELYRGPDINVMYETRCERRNDTGLTEEARWCKPMIPILMTGTSPFISPCLGIWDAHDAHVYLPTLNIWKKAFTLHPQRIVFKMSLTNNKTNAFLNEARELTLGTSKGTIRIQGVRFHGGYDIPNPMRSACEIAPFEEEGLWAPSTEHIKI